MILDASKMPNQRMNSGTHAIEGRRANLARSDQADDRSARSSRRSRRKPFRPRRRIQIPTQRARAWRRRAAQARRSRRGRQTCSKSPTAAAPGARWTSPCAPRFPRTRQAPPAATSRARAAGRARILPSGPSVTARLVRRPRSWRQETRHGLPMQYREIPGSYLAERARGTRPSVRGRHVAIIDKLVDRFLDVDAGADHACLLQRKAGFEDRFPLRRADLVVGELGALLELLVDDGIGQLGDGDEGLLELIVVGERIFARLLVGRDHPPYDVGVILGELLAYIEDAPGIGIAVAVEQPGALVHFVLRHHRVEAGPGVDVAADQEVAAVGVLLHEHRR